MGKSRNTDKYGKYRDFRKDKNKHKSHKLRPQSDDAPKNPQDYVRLDTNSSEQV